MQSSFVLDSHLTELKGRLDENEFSKMCKRYGKVMWEAYSQILSPIFDEHPDLLPVKMGGSYVTNDENYKKIHELISEQTAVSRS